jgi:cobalt-zinc-cadmium efflux system membrane fusion protein
MDVKDERMIQSPEAYGGRNGLGRILVRGLMAIGLIAIGAAGAVLVLRFGNNTPPGPVTAAPTPTSIEAPAVAGQNAVEPADEVEVVVSPEAVAQAGIKTAKVDVVESNTSIQVPGTVMANAYREVKVFPIVGGIITKVHVELGASVRRGVPLAILFSAELAEAQTKYLMMKAMLVADHQKLERTKQLVEIGAASRQELEEAVAANASRATEVEAARQRLLQLGLSRKQVASLSSPSQAVSDVVVPAPINGIITGRSANLGQVVGMGEELFVVTDLSEVWAVGDLYEQDFQTVHVGSEASLTTPAYPNLTLRGRVTYIDPRVDSQTRTAKVRVEVPNANGRLRLGMYVTMAFTTPTGERVVVVPRTAVQTIGDGHVVFVPAEDEEGKFTQRPVQVGRLIGGSYTILDGLQPGEVVVTEGSFFLRAESLRSSPSG